MANETTILRCSSASAPPSLDVWASGTASAETSSGDSWTASAETGVICNCGLSLLVEEVHIRSTRSCRPLGYCGKIHSESAVMRHQALLTHVLRRNRRLAAVSAVDDKRVGPEAARTPRQIAAFCPYSLAELVKSLS